MGSKILIIDDDPIIRDSLQELLSNAGYAVLLAADGISGFELVAREKPDLIVADILLPRMHGIALCEKVKGSDELRYIPIILMTGVYKDVNLRMYVHKRLADDFIEKPFREGDLLAKIERLIGKPPEKSVVLEADRPTPVPERKLDDLISWARGKK
ncbi:MAG: response regulator [Candidatus Aminicenantes bacterium]|nr:response regulator [Candidatus Aminicenantes bacterium]